MSDSKTPSSVPHSPVLKVTGYDRVSAFMVALVVGLVVAVVWLGIVWATNRLPRVQGPVPVELLDLSGGVEDGAIDETLRLDSPEDISSDPSLAETPIEESEIQEMLETVVELSDEATSLAQQQFETEAQNVGQPGSATGSGRRALGMGPGETGLPREQRWYIQFSSRATVKEYARQLDFFKIELGALLANGRIQYVSNLSSDRPTVRTADSGRGESRLYMTWQGGERRKADFELLQAAGINPAQVQVIFHFYPPETEARLARLEHEYANRPADQIRRTYFEARRRASGYEFVVTRQFHFR
jgi:hypothetical protein